MKLIVIIIILGLVVSCQNAEEAILKHAEFLIKDDPKSSLMILDSIKSLANLKVEQLANYYFIKYHATFKCEAKLEAFVPSLQIPIYWLNKGNKFKAGYTYLYTGIIYNNQSSLKEAAICYYEAQKLAFASKDSLLVFYTYYYQGLLSQRNREFRNGQIAFENALQFLPEQNSNTSFYDWIKIANCYLYTENYNMAKYYYNLVEQQVHTKDDSIKTAKMLYLTSRYVKNRNIKKHITNYLKEEFCNDIHAQIYNNLVNAEVHLKKHELNMTYQYLCQIPKDSIMNMPEIILPYYRIWGKYYFQNGESEKALKFFQHYQHTNDRLKTDLFNVQINAILTNYMQSKLESENNLLQVYRVCLMLVIIVLFFVLLLMIFVIYIFKKKKEYQIIEAEMRIDILQELCKAHENKQNEFKNLLINRLEISHQLVNLSSQSIPRNTSFLKFYNEMLGAILPSTLEWEEFYRLIDCLYDDFYKKTIEKFSQLNEKEIQTICLLCGGFKTDEIAFVQNQTIAAVHKRKTAIRKKLNLGDRADIAASLAELIHK